MESKVTSKSSVNGKLPAGEQLSIVSICLDQIAEGELRQFVRGVAFLRLQAEVGSYITEEDTGLTWMHPPGPDICLVDFDSDRAKAITTAEAIHEKLPNTAIFAISSNNEPAYIVEAMRCGCSEYIFKPADRDQLLEAVVRVGGRKKEKSGHYDGQVLAFLGAKGGAGVTTVVTHLATLLAKSLSRRTLLIDLHPTGGDVGLYLGLPKAVYHFYELVENVARLDSELLQSSVVRHASGLDVLPAPDFNDVEKHVALLALGEVLDFARTKYEFVLLDCAPGLTEQNLEVIRRSDHVYLVTVPEVPALRNAARILDYFTRTHASQADTVDVIVNRYSKRSKIPDSEVEKAIRKKILWKVPNHYETVMRTINGGDPVARTGDSEVARNLLTWAEAFGSGGPAQDDKKKSGKGFLGLLGR